MNVRCRKTRTDLLILFSFTENLPYLRHRIYDKEIVILFFSLPPYPGNAVIEFKAELSKPRPHDPRHKESSRDLASSENNIIAQCHHSNGPDETFSIPNIDDHTGSSKDDSCSKDDSDYYTGSPNSMPPPPSTLDELNH